MTRVLPLPAPARINTGPSLVSTASRCCGFSWSRNDKTEVAPEVDLSILQDNLDVKGCLTSGRCCRSPPERSRRDVGRAKLDTQFPAQANDSPAFYPRS